MSNVKCQNYNLKLKAFETFNPGETTLKIIDFLRREVKWAGFQKVIIPLSGGIDSSTVAALAVKALGRENVLIVRLPHRGLNQDNDANLIISQLKIPNPPAGGNIFEIEISGIVKTFKRILGGVGGGEALSRLRLGNIMARVRMTILYDLAKKHKALVCGTENKSEHLLGYFTRFGDEASDLEPIRNLYKTQVVQLAHYLGVPKKIITKPPSAGLWKGQTDERELGFSYQEADPILYLHFEKKYTWEKIEKMGFEEKVVEKAKDRVEKNKFKHGLPRVAELDSTARN